MLISHQQLILKYKTYTKLIMAKRVNLMVDMQNCLICIFMNINENIKNEIKNHRILGVYLYISYLLS